MSDDLSQVLFRERDGRGGETPSSSLFTYFVLRVSEHLGELQSSGCATEAPAQQFYASYRGIGTEHPVNGRLKLT